MNQAGSRVGARCCRGPWANRGVAPGEPYPPFTPLTSSPPAFDANPTRRLSTLDAGGSSREQQEEKGRKR